jgi:hypothetical protein
VTDGTTLVDLLDDVFTLTTKEPIEAVANVAIPLEGADIHVPSVTGPVHVELETLRDAIDLVRNQQALLHRLDEALTAGGYTAEVYVVETQVGLLGADADPGRVSRVVGDGKTEILGRGVARAAVRSP